ncbi:MAG TPA: hypothetical protein VHO69_06525, partial [Phototrophicaceae bacterium]|nr:hypothetical protein [Phototrophicaceae bacterium]
LERMMNFVGSAPQVWWLTVGDTPFAAPFEARLLEHYALLRAEKWTNLTLASEDYGGWKQYLQIPDNLADMFLFGDNLHLQAWSLLESVEVRACQTITVRSWWRLRQRENQMYTVTLALADAGGQGLAQEDVWGAITKPLYWEANQTYLDQRALTIPCNTPSGDYSLVIGAYILSDDGRVTDQPITLPDGRPLGNRAYLTTLFVRP